MSIKTCFAAFCVAATAAITCAAEDGKRDAGAFVRALWAVQRFGKLDAADPQNDERTKALLAKSLEKDGSLTNLVIQNNLMDAKTFRELAGEANRLNTLDVSRALDREVPASRQRLFPSIAAHCDALSTSFDRIDLPHLAAGEKLAEWMVSKYEPGEPLPVIFVCTGNSRRSMMGATMGNIAAAYWGLPEVRCYSGGTAPSAFNSRTIATLKAIGVEIEPTGEEAKRGAEGSPNPIYGVRWGEGDGRRPMESIEFSKHYSDTTNPQDGFAAIMVCSQADAECPMVKGASRRISMPYLDPKPYDDGEFETAKYAERRDDLGRLMLAVMLKARRQLEAKGAAK